MRTHFFAAAASLAITMSATGAFAGNVGQTRTLMEMLKGENGKADDKAETAMTAEPKAEDRKMGTGSRMNPMLKQRAEAENETEKTLGSKPFAPLIAGYAKQYGVPVQLASAVIAYESKFNPKARGAHGEIGLMQIKPETARAMGYNGPASGLYDPDTNLKYGIKYLAMAHQLGGGTTCGAILRYNAGHAATRMNATSKAYCGQVMAMIGESRT